MVEQADPAVQVEPVVTTEVTKAAPEAPKEDWEGKYKASEADNAKLTKQAADGRSREIAVMKQSERDNLTRQTAEKVDLLATAVETQDWGAYRTKVEEINKQASAAASTAETEVARGEALAELMEIDKELGGGLENNPLFENVGLYWRQGMSTGNAVYYQKAVAEAHKAGAKMAREQTATQAKAHVKAIKDAEVAAAKAAKEAAGVFDVGAGADAGAGAKATNDTIDALWVAFDRAHPEQKNPYDAQYSALLRR